MPVVIRHIDNAANGGQPRFADAIELARQCADQYQLNIMPGTGGGIAGGSCWAAVAVTPSQNFPDLNPVNPVGAGPNGGGVHIGGGQGLGFGIAFGNSQMTVINNHVNLPGFAGGGHAEQAAINAAGIGNLHAPGGQAVLFVQLHPCNNCLNFLNGLNLGAVTLNVYYRFAYPDEVNDMENWNQQTRANKQNDITNW